MNQILSSFQDDKRNCLRILAEKHNFKIWETYCVDEFTSGILVFETFRDCYAFCREELDSSVLQFGNCWYESVCGKIASDLLKDMSKKLNEDCILEIARRLDAVCFADLLETIKSTRLIQLSEHRFGNLILNRSTVGDKFGIMNLQYILHAFGDTVTSITVSAQSFRGGYRQKWSFRLNYSILCIICHFAPNVRTLTLEHFNIDKVDIRFQPIFSIFNQRNTILNIN